MTRPERRCQETLGVMFRRLLRLQHFDVYQHAELSMCRLVRPLWSVLLDAPTGSRELREALRLGAFWGMLPFPKPRHFSELFRLLELCAQAAGPVPTPLKELPLPPEVEKALAVAGGRP